MKSELKAVKPPFHSEQHYSQSLGHHEADLRKNDDTKEESKGLTSNTRQEHPSLLRYFSTSRGPESLPETTLRLKSTSHSCLQLLNTMTILLVTQHHLSEKKPAA